DPVVVHEEKDNTLSISDSIAENKSVNKKEAINDQPLSDNQLKSNPQKLSISNVHSQQQGDSVLIYYDILGTTPEQKFDIRVHCSTDGGKIYGEALKSVSGDVGENITGGAGKIIIWDALKDVQKIEGKNIKFDVRAKVKKYE
ncbi:MAG: hypothetical protein HY738_01740, partial [Bacteroidia bacterium]|nr:hypothetical protein [Bacteroidia bacterium]